MAVTLEDLDRRVTVLEEARPADLRVAVTTMVRHLEDTRERMSKVEIRLDGMAMALAHLTAGQAEMRGALTEKIGSLSTGFTGLSGQIAKLEARFTALERNLPSMIAETMREVLRENPH